MRLDHGHGHGQSPGPSRSKKGRGRWRTAPSLLKVSADFSTYPATLAGTMNGVIMQRAIAYAIAAIAFSSLSGSPAVARGAGGTDGRDLDQGEDRSAPIDVAALLTAARGA